MALLRNREVQILRVATEVDGSTFVVRYPDGETEMAKMNELEFTQQEYNSFVKPVTPEVKIIEESKPEVKKIETKKTQA